MHNSESREFLNNNQWVSSAVATVSSRDKAKRLQVKVKPEGHQLISEIGVQAFSKRVLIELPSADRRNCHLELAHIHDQALEMTKAGESRGQPGVLSWIQKQAQHRLLLDVVPELVFFHGHFPDNPVLPGVTQLHWAAQYAINLFGFNDAPYEVKRLKFKNIVQPPMVVELWLEQKQENEVQFQLSSFGQVHSTGSLVFDKGIA